MAICVCCCSYVGRVGEVLLRYFNMYAYTHVAIYGHSFVDASRACIALLVYSLLLLTASLIVRVRVQLIGHL
eukprot:COSAG05_NODE_1277_length_5304_cov_5.087992_4_plen_72_part_00